jgi:hypothetical protein
MTLVILPVFVERETVDILGRQYRFLNEGASVSNLCNYTEFPPLLSQNKLLKHRKWEPTLKLAHRPSSRTQGLVEVIFETKILRSIHHRNPFQPLGVKM